METYTTHKIQMNTSFLPTAININITLLDKINNKNDHLNQVLNTASML